MKIFLAFLILLLGCGEESKRSLRFGVRLNSFRRTVGIPEIPTSYMLYRERNSSITWKVNLERKSPRHAKKIIWFEKDYYTEKDVYYSGKKFMSRDLDAGMIDEEMSISYIIKNGKLIQIDGYKNWMFGGGATYKECLEELNKWGIKLKEVKLSGKVELATEKTFRVPFIIPVTTEN